MIMEFNPAGRVLMVLGRRAEAVEAPVETAPGTVPRPGWGSFNRPTDVAWNANGDFVADGYNNSRVVKVDKNGRWVKTWGERGSGRVSSTFSIRSPATTTAISTSPTAPTAASKCSTRTATFYVNSRSTCHLTSRRT